MQDMVRRAFAKFDERGTGFITTDGLRHVLGRGVPKAEIDKLIKEFDSDNDGRINYQEFLEHMQTDEIIRSPTASASTNDSPSSGSKASGHRGSGTTTTTSGSSSGSNP